jgi:hypothetical protein
MSSMATRVLSTVVVSGSSLPSTEMLSKLAFLGVLLIPVHTHLPLRYLESQVHSSVSLSLSPQLPTSDWLTTRLATERRSIKRNKLYAFYV